MLVQVFLYRDDEERVVSCKAAEVDPDARRQNYTPLSVKQKVGDRVKAKLTMSGKGIEVDESIQEMIWQGHYTDCQFGVFVPDDYQPSSMIGTVMLTVNDIPCGRMMFKTKIVVNLKSFMPRLKARHSKRYSYLTHIKMSQRSIFSPKHSRHKELITSSTATT